jgi:hypothetical protein
VQSAPPMPPPVSTPPSQMQSPAPAGRSPLRAMAASPLASPLKKTVASVRDCLEEVGNITRLADPRDAWLPITESRSGNAYYAAFHNLSSGIGFQALVLPVAFTFLGWCVLLATAARTEHTCRMQHMIPFFFVTLRMVLTLVLSAVFSDSLPAGRGPSSS